MVGMNRDDVTKTFKFLGHSPVEVSIIAPPQFKGDTNAGVKHCSLVSKQGELIALCDAWEGKANIYVGLNELKPAYKARRGHRTQKNDIVAVHFVPIDIDPVKPDGMKYQATTDEELQHALDTGKALADWFQSQGFKAPALAMSGNGCQLWARIPSYNLKHELTDGKSYRWELRLKSFLDEARAAIPSELADKVKIDPIHDVTRILKVIGTTSTKGDPSQYPERPHRESYWITDPPIGQVNTALRVYICSIPIDQAKSVSTQQVISVPTATTQKPQKPQKPQHAVTLPTVSDEQKRILDRALKAPYVGMTRQRIDRNDMSGSDWAFLKELSKEGIYDTDILKYALRTEKDTKFFRDGRDNYIEKTIANFSKKLKGKSVSDAQQDLEKEFENISVDGKKIILCGAQIALGKTHCAKKKVIEAVEQGINVLVIVPSHALATEWEKLELPDKLREIYETHEVNPLVHLYGITHENVQCPHSGVGMKLISMGHSKLFKAKYCYGTCKKRKECLHIQSVFEAKNAPILLAQHEHSHIHQGFFQLKTLGNDNRAFVVIDELAQFVHAVRLNRKDLHGNMILYRTIANQKAGKHSDVYFYDFLADRLEIMLNALDNRKDYSLPAQFFAISPTDANKLDAENARYYMEAKRTPKVKNILWDLCYILEHKPSLQYEREKDCLLYRWRPNFSNRTVLILSGTTRREYVESQLGNPIDESIATDWDIRRNNLKVIQLIVGMGGRNRLLKQCDGKTFTAQHGKLFNLILHKHTKQRIALITSLGNDAPDTEKEGNAKRKILRALSPIAERHKKKLISVSNEMLQKDVIPDGIKEIPVFHFGMKGIDKLHGRFDVIWEVNAHYYHRHAIQQAVFDKFNMDITSAAPEREKVEFHAADPTQNFEAIRYVYDDSTVELEIEHTQTADMIQTEGRFLREEKVYKVIYRTHNVNIPPRPTRVYKSWQGLFKFEFAPYVPPEAWLMGKASEIWEWIKANTGDKEFTADEVAKGIGMNTDDIRNKYLNQLAKDGILEIVNAGKKGRGNATTYKVKSGANVGVG